MYRKKFKKKNESAFRRISVWHNTLEVKGNTSKQCQRKKEKKKKKKGNNIIPPDVNEERMFSLNETYEFDNQESLSLSLSLPISSATILSRTVDCKYKQRQSSF